MWRCKWVTGPPGVQWRCDCSLSAGLDDFICEDSFTSRIPLAGPAGLDLRSGPPRSACVSRSAHTRDGPCLDRADAPASNRKTPGQRLLYFAARHLEPFQFNGLCSFGPSGGTCKPPLCFPGRSPSFASSSNPLGRKRYPGSLRHCCAFFTPSKLLKSSQFNERSTEWSMRRKL